MFVNRDRRESMGGFSSNCNGSIARQLGERRRDDTVYGKFAPLSLTGGA